MIEETRITQPETSADLSEKAMSINASIARLQEILKRYGPTGASDNFSGKARDQLKRAVYHFRKDALRDMAANLDSMQNALNTTLLVYAWANFQSLNVVLTTSGTDINGKTLFASPKKSSIW